LVDARTGILPKRVNWLTCAVVAAAVLAASYWQGSGLLINAGSGSLLAGGLFYLIWRFTQLGFGDVRLAFLIGLVSGTLEVKATLAALAVGATIGVLLGIGRTALGKSGGYPFGPALVAGCLLSVPLTVALLE
jgi:leader peptidase (prepilin peptidase)/N-methyltransferase